MIKPVIIIARTIYCIYIILISYTAFNWTCVMENGDLDITFHMESFFWPVRFIASLIWKLLPNRVKLFIVKHIGFLQYIAKLKGHIFQLWEHIKRS